MGGRLPNSTRLVGLTVLVLWMSAPAYSQVRGIAVYGRVFLPDNRPAIQITVNISGQNGFNASTMTDGRGGFRFDGIPRSLFHLTVVPPSNTRYYADSVSVDTSREGDSFMADIFLRNPLEAGVKRSKSSVVSVREANQQIPKDARKALGKAQKYRDQKKFDAALAELDKAIGMYPEYFQAFTEKGIVQINAGHLKEAFQAFDKAIEIFPQHEPALSGAGYCLLSLGNYEQSIAFLEKAVQLDANHPKNLLFLGIANLALNRWQRAQEVLEQALKLDAAGAVTAHMYLADALAAQHLYSRAADELHTYLEKNPEAPNAERLLQREKYLRAQKTQP